MYFEAFLIFSLLFLFASLCFALLCFALRSSPLRSSPLALHMLLRTLLRTLLLTLCSSLLALCVGVLDSTLIVCHAHILIRHCVCAGGAGPVCTLLCVCHAHILLFVCGLHILLSLCHAHILIRHCVCGCISMHVCACMCMHACVCLMHTYSFAIVWGVPGVWPSHPPHMPQLPCMGACCWLFFCFGTRGFMTVAMHCLHDFMTVTVLQLLTPKVLSSEGDRKGMYCLLV